jgi:CO/xanthine dehydrogenase FAD-binding subunit
MKPARFVYHDPTSVEEAIDLLADYGDGARILAGGQSLVPLLNFRVVQPDHIIDLGRLPSLDHVTRDDGQLSIGAMTRQATVAASSVVQSGWPVLTEALAFVGHPQIRNRGTVGGSVAHADPAAELPVALAALDANFKLRSRRGLRTVGWRDLFVTYLTTSIEPDELLVEIDIPPVPSGTGYHFTEFARRHGDFALAGAAVMLVGSGGGALSARIGLLGGGDTPLRPAQAERFLSENGLGEHSVNEAARLAVIDLEPFGDIHGSSEYRRHLLEVMVRDAIMMARERCDA